MAKRKEDEPPAGSPAWMATFSDLMNLLLCFFVMLFSMSTIEEDKLAAFVASMNNTISIFSGGSTAIGDGILISNGVSQLNELDQYINSTGKFEDSENDGESMNEHENSPEALEEMLEQGKLQQNEETAEKIEESLTESEIGDEVDVSFTAQYIELNIGGALLFDSGSADVKAGSKEILDKIGMILERFSNGMIEIEGHTDNVPHNGERYRDNEELSDARARAVFSYLLEHTSINPANMKHSGMGDRQPVADNSTEEGRSLNRRVVIRILNPAQN